jgi:hypothetical protein
MALNFTSATPTLNAAIAENARAGSFSRFIVSRMSTSATAATTSCGGVTGYRYPISIPIPTVGSGCAGYIGTNITAANEDGSTLMVVGLEYLLGTLTVSGNSFTNGVAMPTKTVRGASITTAASLCFAVVTTALTATSPVLTTTYVDQDGNSGASSTITIPTNALINSTYYLQPHLASGDLGMRDVTNLSISTGSAGVISVYGILPLLFVHTVSTTAFFSDLLSSTQVAYLIGAGESIGVYRFGATTASDLVLGLTLTPEPS